MQKLSVHFVGLIKLPKVSVRTKLPSGSTNLRVHVVVTQFSLSSCRFIYTFSTFTCQIIVNEREESVVKQHN